MIARNVNTMTDKAGSILDGLVVDVACPICGESLLCVFVLPFVTDCYGRKMRQAVGWCGKHETELELLQFEKVGNWTTHRYRKICSLDQSRCCRTWRTVCELPVVSPVVIGPGGEYTRCVNMSTIKALRAARAVADIVVGMMRRLRGFVGVLRGL